MSRRVEMGIVAIVILIQSLMPIGKINAHLSGKISLRRKITIPVWIHKFNIFSDYQI